MSNESRPARKGRLNLRQIEVFRAVMVTGTISGAAETLLVSQPAVSRLLSHMEQSVGFPLFERIKGRLFPTPEARRLFTEVENVYNGVQRVNTAVRDLAWNRKGQLRLACHHTVGASLVPKAIGQFHQTFPDTSLVFECVRHLKMNELVLNQQADLGVTLFPVDHPSLEAVTLCDVPMVVALPPRHPLASHRQLSPEQISEHRLLGYKQGGPFVPIIERIFATSPHPPPPIIDADTPRDACALVDAGAGIAIVDAYSAHEFVGPTLVARRIAGASPLQAIAIYKKYEPMSQAARAFLDLLSTMARKRSEETP